MIQKLLKNKWALPVICLLVGAAIGAVFYPSKTITREETARYEAKIEKLEDEKRETRKDFEANLNMMERVHKEFKRESETKISSLRTENTHLKKRVKERIIKIVSPDGTIREETVRESDTEVVSQIVTDIKQEFTEKVASIESKWKSVHERRVTAIRDTYEKKLSEKQHIIDTYSKKEKIEINKRSFGVSLGYTSYDKYFSSISYDVFGPFFLDLHLQGDSTFKDSGAGVGIGFRF